MMKRKWTTFLAISLLSLSPLAAQQGASKEAQKFRSQIDDTKKSVIQAREQLQAALGEFNGIVEGKAKKVESAYKALEGDVKKVEKTVTGLQKQVAGMDKQAEGFFAGWDAQIQTYQAESLQEAARARLETAKGKYDEMRANMSAAGEAYKPFMSSLKDQVNFLGTDLSPEALEALQPEVGKLNAMGDELFARIEKILNEESADEEEFDEAVSEEDSESGEQPAEEASEGNP